MSNQLPVNAPDSWWWQGDGGQTASPGGWLRVFGKSLNFGGQSQASLRAADGATVPLATREASGYALTFAVPKDLAPGDYSLSVHNGLAGDAAGRAAGIVSVRPPAVWKDELFNVKDFGPKPGEALLAALKKAEANGGGIVYLPRGRYPVKDTLTIPPNTVLKGEAMELVSLYWPDFDKPPVELVTGANFGLESLSLYTHNRLQQMFGADREMMTLDAGGGAYFGKIAAASGTKLTLAGDPAFHDYAPKPHTNWTGAMVSILDGRGAGQYRLVTAHEGREWEVDRPWTVPPDASSRISIAPFRGRNLFIGNTSPRPRTSCSAATASRTLPSRWWAKASPTPNRWKAIEPEREIRTRTFVFGGLLAVIFGLLDGTAEGGDPARCQGDS